MNKGMIPSEKPAKEEVSPRRNILNIKEEVLETGKSIHRGSKGLCRSPTPCWFENRGPFHLAKANYIL